MNEAVTSASKAAVDLYTNLGSAANSKEIRNELNRQLDRQRNTTALRQQEFNTYRDEMDRVAKVFGTNSNQYREAQENLAEIGQQLEESRNAEAELKQAMEELNYTFAQNVIESIKSFVDKLSSLTQLATKRGTNPVLGYQVTEGMYTDQVAYNNDLINRYYDIR